MNNGWYRRSTTNYRMEFVTESGQNLQSVFSFDHYYDYYKKSNADITFVNTQTS